MYRLRTVEGLRLPEIGERYGVSAERVRQILDLRVVSHTAHRS